MSKANLTDTITADEFNARCANLLGVWGWKSSFAAYLGYNNNTLSAWSLGQSPVPRAIVAVLELLEAQRAAGLPLPEGLIKRTAKTAA